MRRVKNSEIETDFEREFAWGDDERHLYNRNKKKAAVMGFHLRLKTVIDMVKSYLHTGARVADIASAQGNFGLLLAEAGFDVTAVDLNEDFLRYARKKYTHGKFTTLQANLMEFRSTEPFDGVIMGEIIEHVAFPKDLLQTARANLKSGGMLFLTTPNGDEFGQPLPTYRQVTNIEELIPRQFHWGDHLFLYTEDELRELLEEAGFELLQCLKLNSSYVSQLKGIRYLMPHAMLRWLERKTRNWKIQDKDSTNCLVVVARKR